MYTGLLYWQSSNVSDICCKKGAGIISLILDFESCCSPVKYWGKNKMKWKSLVLYNDYGFYLAF